MLRRATGSNLVNNGQDTRTIQQSLSPQNSAKGKNQRSTIKITNPARIESCFE